MPTAVKFLLSYLIALHYLKPKNFNEVWVGGLVPRGVIESRLANCGYVFAESALTHANQTRWVTSENVGGDVLA